MYGNYIYRDINEALPRLLDHLSHAPEVGSRNGKTKELTHVGITLTNPLSREILVPERRANPVAQIAETAWVLAGRNDVDWLSNYLPRAADFSDDGKTWRSGYGPRLRKWGGDNLFCGNCGHSTTAHHITPGVPNSCEYSYGGRCGCTDFQSQGSIDQLAYVVDALRTTPETRQAVIQLWDPAVDTAEGPFKDRACNNWLHFLARDGQLDLHVAIRSNDAMWGWSGINAFEWSVLLEIVAGMTGLAVGSLHFSVSSFHLYERHWDRAERIVLENQRSEPITTEPSPRYDRYWTGASIGQFDQLLGRWFQVEYDIRTGSPMVSHYIDTFPEPMLKSWLIAIDWWWNGQFHRALTDGLKGTALQVACEMGVRPPWYAGMKAEEHTRAAVLNYGGGPDKIRDMLPISPFLDHAIRTHNEKHAAYGDSWKRRGEMLGIMSNIARKVDRLGRAETSDETSADTAMDLMIYTAKYRTWLTDEGASEVEFTASDTPDAANWLLIEVEREMAGWFPQVLQGDYHVENLENDLRVNFDLLEKQVMSQDLERWRRVDQMLRDAYLLARCRFEQQQPDDYRGADHE